jgi:hypothetical protein
VREARTRTRDAGVRWERCHNFYPEQTKEAGQFSAIFPANTYPRQDVLTWVDTVPRVGASWDVLGNGRTVVKGSFGMFGDTMGDLYSNNFNPNDQATQRVQRQRHYVHQSADRDAVRPGDRYRVGAGGTRRGGRQLLAGC